MTRLTSFIFFWLLFATVAISAYEPCESCIDRATPSVLANIKLRLYPNRTIADFISVLVGNALNLLPSMNNSKPTVVIIFGWMATIDSVYVTAILDAYFQRGDHNTILVDWTEIATNISYSYAAYSVDGVGYTLAMAFNKLAAAGLNSRTIHIVGHSLGAQTAGFIGRYSTFKLSRITGLDPAGPGFGVLIAALTLADALFVDVIHTDAGVSGTSGNTGTVDFFPNGGVNPQPGCLLSGTVPNACSHIRAFEYYVESLLYEFGFIGVVCTSWYDFVAGSCSSNAEVVMGYRTPTTARGTVYLQTNSRPRFGRGRDGKTYRVLEQR